MEWNLLEQIKLRQYEIRLRNADKLRLDVQSALQPFGEAHVLNPWAVVRSAAVEIMVCSQTCVDEYRALILDLAAVAIPDTELAAVQRREVASEHAKAALKIVEPIYANICVVIDLEDRRVA
jgi:hypothetical protein